MSPHSESLAPLRLIPDLDLRTAHPTQNFALSALVAIISSDSIATKTATDDDCDENEETIDRKNQETEYNHDDENRETENNTT